MPLRLPRLALLGRLAGAAMLLAPLAAVPAQARVHVWVGVPLPFWGPPVYYPPPIYYPPPVYYAPPPPVVYAPPEAEATPFAGSCNAGPYVCPLDHALPAGARCYCLDNSGRRVFGQAG